MLKWSQSLGPKRIDLFFQITLAITRYLEMRLLDPLFFSLIHHYLLRIYLFKEYNN